MLNRSNVPQLFILLLALHNTQPPAVTAESPSASQDRESALPDEQQDQAAALIQQGKSLLEDGLNHNDQTQIMQARATFERVTESPEYAALAHYYVALSDYRMLNLTLSQDRRQARTHLNSAIDHLKEATDLDQQFAEAWALLSSCYGQKIGLSPLTGILLGPKAGQAKERAAEIAPDNPRIVLIGAISDFYSPKAFGGSKERAVEGFYRAAELFERATAGDPLLPDWGHEETYAWIGIAHTDAGNIEQAREAFEKALALNPDYGWVKYVLLPQLPPQDR